MPLNSLTLDELRKLNDTVTSLVMAGFRLEQDGLAPRFDLTPGMPIRLTLGAVMPLATRPDFGAWLTWQIESTEAAQPEPAPEPVDAPPAAGEGAGGEPISAEPSRTDEVAVSPKATPDEGEAERGGGAVMAAAIPPAAPVPGSASAMAAKVANAWSEEDDRRLIEDMVASVSGGMSKTRAIEAAAKVIGRTPGATSVRFYASLAGRFAAALAEAALQQAQTETPAIPEVAKTGPDQGEAAAEEDIPAAVQSSDPLTAHLLGLTDKGGWSRARDLELIELSCQGWPVGDIGIELRMQASAVKLRFDALTGLHDDEATGKKVRRWTREQVLAALQDAQKARAA